MLDYQNIWRCNILKKDIHPKYETCKVTCACAIHFETRSTTGDMRVSVVTTCRPFTQVKRVVIAGRLEKFRQKYAGVNYGQKSAKEGTEE